MPIVNGCLAVCLTPCLWTVNAMTCIMSIVVENVNGISKPESILSMKHSYNAVYPIEDFLYDIADEFEMLCESIIDRELFTKRFHIFGEGSTFYLSSIRKLRTILEKLRVDKCVRDNIYYTFSPEVCRCLAHFLYTFESSSVVTNSCLHINECLEKAIMSNHYWCLVKIAVPTKQKFTRKVSRIYKERVFY